ncbi:hypothetical protein [Mesorhizobium sp. M0244]|uniref:hypothetical protein n=1 Tax=Mesorhizobium sp. M0244 TaxID=2956926 RepID=UPI00333BA4E8
MHHSFSANWQQIIKPRRAQPLVECDRHGVQHFLAAACQSFLGSCLIAPLPGPVKCFAGAESSGGSGHGLRRLNGSSKHRLRGVGLLFIDMRQHQDHTLCGIRLARLLADIGQCPEKSADNAAQDCTDEGRFKPSRAEGIDAGEIKGAEAGQQTGCRAKSGTGAWIAQDGADFVIVGSDDTDLLAANSSRLKRCDGTRRLVIGIKKSADGSH